MITYCENIILRFGKIQGFVEAIKSFGVSETIRFSKNFIMWQPSASLMVSIIISEYVTDVSERFFWSTINIIQLSIYLKIYVYIVRFLAIIQMIYDNINPNMNIHQFGLDNWNNVDISVIDTERR